MKRTVRSRSGEGTLGISSKEPPLGRVAGFCGWMPMRPSTGADFARAESNSEERVVRPRTTSAMRPTRPLLGAEAAGVWISAEYAAASAARSPAAAPALTGATVTVRGAAACAAAGAAAAAIAEGAGAAMGAEGAARDALRDAAPRRGAAAESVGRAVTPWAPVTGATAEPAAGRAIT